MLRGSCNCRGVVFTVSGESKQPVICHCGQCRKQSGHLWSSTWVPESNLTLISDKTLGWYRSSDFAKRGFCTTCGAFLFWKHDDEAEISIAMGAMDGPTGLTLDRHIFVADKGDYYDISDTLPQQAQ